MAFINRETTTNLWSSTGGITAASVVFRVIFSENINTSTLSAADFALSTTGSIASAVIGVPGQSTPTMDYLITVSGYTGTGTLGLNYVDNNDANAVKDLAGNSTITSVTNADGDFTTGQTFSIVLPEPTNNVTSVSAKAISSTSAQVSWVNAVLGTLPTHLLILAKRNGLGTYDAVADGTLVSSDVDFSNNNGASIVNLITNPTQTSLIFTGLSSLATYDFIVYPYTLSPNNSADNVDYKTTGNPSASVILNELTVASLNSSGTGIAASPLGAGANNKAVLGFSLTSNGSQTLSALTILTSSSTIGPLSNFRLIRSDDNTFTTTGDNVVIGGLTLTPSPTQVAITGLNEVITSTLNYFLIADVSTSVNDGNAAIQFSFTPAGMTLSNGFANLTSLAGTNYTFAGSQESEIIFNGGSTSDIAYEGFPDPSPSPLTTTNTVSLASFQIRDGAGTNDPDNLTTTLTTLQIQFSNYANLKTVALFDGSSNVAEVNVTADIVQFTGLAIIAPDFGTKSFALRATFATTVTDNHVIQATIIGASALSSGSGFVSSDGGGATSGSTANNIQVTATKALFKNPPAEVLVNQSFGLNVAAADGNDNIQKDLTGSVTLSKVSGSGILSAGDVGGLTRSLSVGLASWSLVDLNAVDPYIIRATISGLTVGDANIDVKTIGLEPSLQATNIVFSSPTINSMVVNFTNGDGSGRLLVAKATTSVDSDPQDANAYTISNVFGSGSQLGTGNYVVGSGPGPITVTGLSQGVTYHFRVYEFNGAGVTINYNANTGTVNPASFSTLFAPIIDSFDPTSGVAGTSVTITGTNLSGASAVSFGGTAASSFNPVSATSVTAVVGSGASGEVSVTTPGGTATLAGFTFIVAPTISSFAPTSGGAGAIITITGTNFTGATAVSFGGTAAKSFTVSATSITAIVDTGTSGSVSVTTPGGEATSTGFIFIPAPTISSFLPTTAAKGTTVTITGTNLTGATAISFGGTAATSLEVISATSMTAVIGSGTSGSVSVSTPGGVGTLAGFTFIPAPTISSFIPTKAGAGTTVTIAGTNFTGVTEVSFGGIVATTFEEVSAISITAVVESGASGVVSVTTPGGTATKTGFTFIPAPTISFFLPESGGTGALITITGTDLSGATEVSFGGTIAEIDFVSSTSIKAIVASGSSGNVSVTTPGGIGTKAGFTFIPTPTITGFNPLSGKVGDLIEISGTNFSTTAANNTVKFGGIAATVATSPAPTATSLTVSVPIGAAGIGKITVEVGGQMATSANDFTVLDDIDITAPSVVHTAAASSPFNVALTINANITDGESAVTSTILHWRSVAATTTSFTPVTMNNSSGSTWSGEIPNTAMKDLGVEYYIIATNSAGKDNSSSKIIYRTAISHPAGSLTIEPIVNVFGREQSNYRMIAIPLTNMTNNTVNGIFASQLGSYDNTKWTMWHYDNSKSDEVELGGTSPLVPGSGYWFLSSVPATISIGDGQTVSTNKPFEIILGPNWNQIGNPYLFDIDWNDVLEELGADAIKISSKPRKYNGSKDDTQEEIAAFEGAYIENKSTSPVTIKIPLKKTIGGRIASKKQNPLDSDDWEIMFSLKNANQTFIHGGLGMHRDASNGFDYHDDSAMPLFADYLDIQFDNDVSNRVLTKDVVSVADNYVWELKVQTNMINLPSTLSWSNDYFGANDKEIWLLNKESGEVYDMRKVNAVDVGTNFTTSKLKVAMGSLSFVKEATVPDVPAISVSPNPFEDRLSVSIALPKQSWMTLDVYDLSGKKVRNLANGVMEKGRYLYEWDIAKGQLAGGIYLVRFQTDREVKYQRVIKY